jgi:hypothetical protein
MLRGLVTVRSYDRRLRLASIYDLRFLLSLEGALRRFELFESVILILSHHETSQNHLNSPHSPIKYTAPHQYALQMYPPPK